MRLIPLLLAAVAGPDTTLSGRIDAFLEPYVRNGYWSGAVVVMRGDTVLHLAGYGWASAEHAVPNTPRTRFGVASVSKAFTALAAARLWTAGIVQRDAPIARWLPRFPGGDRITIAHLVRHRSGIVDTDDLPGFDALQRQPHSLTELVQRLGAHGLAFEPGTRYQYSNGGYTVLAAVLSAATGLPFEAVLDQWVFGPARMRSSGELSADALVEHLAHGYLLAPAGGLTRGPCVHPSNKVGAGSAYTTADDVASFHRALRDDVLVAASVRDSLFRHSDSPLGEPRIYFGGRGPSYTAAIQIFPGSDAMVAALGNNYGRLNEEISDGIAALLHGRWTDDRVDRILGRALPFPDVPLAANVADARTGSYRHPWGFAFSIEREGRRLIYVDSEHRTRTPLLAQSDSILISPWQWAQLTWTGAELEWRWLDFPARTQTVGRVTASRSVHSPD